MSSTGYHAWRCRCFALRLVHQSPCLNPSFSLSYASPRHARELARQGSRALHSSARRDGVSSWELIQITINYDQKTWCCHIEIEGLLIVTAPAHAHMQLMRTRVCATTHETRHQTKHKITYMLAPPHTKQHTCPRCCSWMCPSHSRLFPASLLHIPTSIPNTASSPMPRARSRLQRPPPTPHSFLSLTSLPPYRLLSPPPLPSVGLGTMR